MEAALQALKAKRKMLLRAALLFGLWFCWRLEPVVVVTFAQIQHSEKEVDELGPDPVADQIVRMGGRSVGPILQAIKKDTPWSKNTVFLSHVLGRIGKPAHEGLLDAIALEPDPKVRIGYIYCLQDAFGDYSKLPEWLDSLKDRPYTSSYLRTQFLFAGMHPMPEILTPEDRPGPRDFTRHFLLWYRQHSRPRGRFPAWTPK